MSGICGVVARDGAPVAGDTLRRMAEAAAHRGPDGCRTWEGGPVGLVHQALHVTPTCAEDRLPIVQDGLALTADARIDNLRELGTLLAPELRGAPATHGSVILAGYRRWGHDLPRHLIGDFAFAIWDSEARTLFAARDPMGLRPFYYRIEPRRVVFGTEVKQLLAVPDVPTRIHEPMVAAFLAGAAPSPEWTFYEGISSLVPGHSLLVGPQGRSILRFWEAGRIPTLRLSSEDEYTEAFRELFREAVRCRIHSPRPVGVFLSGGVDSGSVAGTGGQLLQGDPSLTPALRAYSFAFDELRQSDEREVSRSIVEEYELPWTHVPADDAWPLGESAEYRTDRDAPGLFWFERLWHRSVALARSEGTVVLLGGDRGDLVGGESIYDHTGLFWRGAWPTLLHELRMLARWQNEPFLRVARRSLLQPLSRTLRPHSAPRRWLRRLSGRARSPTDRSPPWVRDAFLDAQGLAEASREIDASMRLRGEARNQRYRAIFAPSQMFGFVESERLYARHGTSFADPFSDRRIAEWVLAVPQRVVNRPDDRKRLIRRAMQGIVPQTAARSQAKVSPWPLAERGIREREVEAVRGLIRGSLAAQRGWIDESTCMQRYDAYLQGGERPLNFWCTLSLERWLRHHWS